MLLPAEDWVYVGKTRWHTRWDSNPKLIHASEVTSFKAPDSEAALLQSLESDLHQVLVAVNFLTYSKISSQYGLIAR